MALRIFDGIPGMGKTYSSMFLEILPHLAAGGVVVTNIEIKSEGIAVYLKERYGKVFNPDRIIILEEEECPNFFRHTPKGAEDCPVLVVLDEVHLWFNSRDWAKSDANLRETFQLATQHRKFHLDIILISQHLSNIDGQFLKLVAGLTRFKDLSKIPLFPFIPWLKMPYWRFVATHFDRTGKVRRGPRDWMRADKLVFGTYNTLAVLKGGEVMAGSASVERQALPVDPAFAAGKARLRKALLWLLVFGMIASNLYLLFRPAPAVAALVPMPAPAAPQRVAPIPQAISPVIPSKPQTFLETPPIVEVLTARAVGGWTVRKVLVEMDGSWQWLIPGGWCTRGRVAYVRCLQQISLHEAEIWDDEGQRRKFRVVLKHTPAGTREQPQGTDDEGPVFDGEMTITNEPAKP